MTKPWIALRTDGAAWPRRPTQGSRAWTPAPGSARNTAVSACPLSRRPNLCAQLGLWANVEIKPARGFERETGVAVAKLALELRGGASISPLLSSFEPASLEAG